VFQFGVNVAAMNGTMTICTIAQLGAVETAATSASWGMHVAG